MGDAAGQRRKLIVFSEHRDTLNFLEGEIVGYLGKPEAVAHIHGGTPREDARWSRPSS